MRLTMSIPQLQLHKLLVCLIIFCLCGCDNRPNKSEVINKIKNASKLSTTQFIISKYIFAQKKKKFLFITSSKDYFAAHTYAVIEAGIDFAKITKGDIDVNILEKSISIKLPKVEVLSFSYSPTNYTKLERFSFHKGIGGKFNVSDYDELFRNAQLEIQESLEFINIKPQVEKNTRTLLESYLQNLDFRAIYITFSNN